MSNPNHKRTIRWRRITFVSAALAAVAFAAATFPLARHALGERAAQRVKETYATGLSRCDGYHPADIDALLQEHLPAQPTAAITVLPAFSNTEAIRLVGQDLFYFVIDPPQYEMGTGRSLNTKGVLTVNRSRISKETARGLIETLDNDIGHAQAEHPLGLDGVSFYFRSAPQNCAKTWSPSAPSRASKFAALFDELAKHARGSTDQNATSERAIVAVIQSLQVE